MMDVIYGFSLAVSVVMTVVGVCMRDALRTTLYGLFVLTNASLLFGWWS